MNLWLGDFGFKHCGSGDKRFLICHVIPKDYMFQDLCDFRKPLIVSHYPATFND